jgi:AraC-like DNA-binding protein
MAGRAEGGAGDTFEAPALLVPAAIVRGLAFYALTRGLQRETLFAAMGVTEGDLADPDRPLDVTVLKPLWEQLEASSRDEPVALAVARAFSALDIGLVGQMVKHSPTLRIGLSHYARYGKLHMPQLSFPVAQDKDGDIIFYENRASIVHEVAHPVEYTLAAVYLHVKNFQDALPMRGVMFSHRARYAVAPYEAFFGAPVRFEQQVDALLLAPGALDLPSPLGNDVLVRYLEAHAQHLYAGLPPPVEPLVGRIRGAIGEDLSAGEIDQARVARKLGMSTRTLQRRLADLGTSFQDVLDDLRRDIALRMLRERSGNVFDVAFVLGYADTPSFYRAFKRWTGRTPQQWRAAPL